jgi:CBS domain-containing protein
MTLRDILAVKGSTVFTIAPDATLQQLAEKLVEHRVGALLVRREGDPELLGIVTERDLLYAQASGKGPPEAVRVAEIASSPLVTGQPDDDVERAMGLMTTRRIRHLPVLAEGELVGLVSIGDLVKAQFDRLARENQLIKDYLQASY